MEGGKEDEKRGMENRGGWKGRRLPVNWWSKQRGQRDTKITERRGKKKYSMDTCTK